MPPTAPGHPHGDEATCRLCHPAPLFTMPCCGVSENPKENLPDGTPRHHPGCRNRKPAPPPAPPCAECERLYVDMKKAVLETPWTRVVEVAEALIAHRATHKGAK